MFGNSAGQKTNVTTHKVHQEFYNGGYQWGGSQKVADSRMLHVFDRPSVSPVLRERVY